MSEILEIDASDQTEFATALANLPHETYAIVHANNNGQRWAAVSISPMTNTIRAAFPLSPYDVRGDASKRAQAGVMALWPDPSKVLNLVIKRSVRMFKESK